MIAINQVDNGRYPFPTIDFKFVNQGKSSAVLWQFTIIIEEAEVDPRPEIEVSWATSAGRTAFSEHLSIAVKNNGWGRALDFDALLQDRILARLLPESQRRFIGFVDSGQDRKVLDLKCPRVSGADLEEMARSFQRDAPSGWDRFDAARDMPTSVDGAKSIPLLLPCAWHCKDAKGRVSTDSGKYPGLSMVIACLA